jgi:hypothetical protein
VYHPLRVVGLAQVGVEHLLCGGFLGSGRRLRRNKYGTNLLHQIRIVDLQDPRPGSLGLSAQKSQTVRRRIPWACGTSRVTRLHHLS